MLERIRSVTYKIVLAGDVDVGHRLHVAHELVGHLGDRGYLHVFLDALPVLLQETALQLVLADVADSDGWNLVVHVKHHVLGVPVDDFTGPVPVGGLRCFFFLAAE